MLKKIRLILAIVLITSGSLLLIWAFAPLKQQVSVQLIAPAAMRVAQGGEAAGPAFLESRQLKVVWPETMRIGEKASIQLDFDKVENDSPGGLPGDLYDAYKEFNLMAEARFEAAGIHFEPINPTRESLLAGQAIKFKWEITAVKSGAFHGTLWLSLRFLPLDGSAATQVPIFVQEVSMHSTSFLGLTAPMAKIIGGACAFSGLLLAFNVMIIGRIKKLLIKDEITA